MEAVKKSNTPQYPEVSPNPDFVKIEERVLDSWKEQGVFQKSIDQRDGAEEFVFYDGPPFANGLPHYGHLLTSCVKDIFARYQTMKGKKVERRFGWDCHGLPAEMEAEKELKVSGRKAIEEYGIDKFNDHCRSSVMKYTGIWQDYVNRAARWVDFENDYKTMDTSYMESVLWAFKQLYDKGLVYESSRVMPYSWAAQTPLSNFETKMDDAYRERVDKAVTVAFRLREVPEVFAEDVAHLSQIKNANGELLNPEFAHGIFVAAWTTTPWTLPSNLALAVSNGVQYKLLKKDGKVVIAAEQWGIGENAIFFNDIDESTGELATTSSEAVSGSALFGLSYEPMFPYFKDQPNAFRVLDGSDFIEEGSGTGVVHLAPGFGEDDQRVCAAAGIDVVCPVDEAGRYTDAIFDLPLSPAQAEAQSADEKDSRLRGNDEQESENDETNLPPLSLKGLNVIKQLDGQCEDEPYKPEQLEKYGLANLRIINWLKMTGALIKQDDYAHSYPHCWRTDEPIIYMAMPSWYVEVTKFRDRMVELNHANINWIPEHIRDGQFGKWLENARDWSISRNRFWGTPIPVWRRVQSLESGVQSSEIKVFGSIVELEEFFGVEVKDLHRPFIDELKTAKDGSEWRRVSDVFDCWFESGSMPYAQAHYPFENKEWFESHFPGDFIVEYVGQTRGWFYTLMVLSTALFDCVPFKNCICHGIILAADGKKLSKKLRNYPDPNEMFDTYGADAMRWRMVSEPIMQGGNLLMAKDGSDIRDQLRLTIKPIWNAYSFFCLYANADGVRAQMPSFLRKQESRDPSVRWDDGIHLMDRYILAKCRQSVEQIEMAMDGYDTPGACKAVDGFFEVLNNWYIRRSKERFWRAGYDADKQAAYDTLYTVLTTMVRAAAPLLPLIAEEVYRGLTGEESVHLADWPEVSAFPEEAELVADMDKVRDACNTILSIRNAENIRTRQPLAKAMLYGDGASRLREYADIVKDEVNVKEVAFADGLGDIATLKLTINFPVAGKRLGPKMKEVAGAAKQGKWELLESEDSRLSGNGETGLPRSGDASARNDEVRVRVGDEILEPGEFEIQLEPKDPKGAQALSSNDALVVLDLNITPELEAEGYARDLVRAIQDSRKRADLNISDRIDLWLVLPKNLEEAAKTNQSYIAEQTLAKTMAFEKPDESEGKGSFETQIEGEPVTIVLSVAR